MAYEFTDPRDFARARAAQIRAAKEALHKENLEFLDPMSKTNIQKRAKIEEIEALHAQRGAPKPIRSLVEEGIKFKIPSRHQNRKPGDMVRGSRELAQAGPGSLYVQALKHEPLDLGSPESTASCTPGIAMFSVLGEWCSDVAIQASPKKVTYTVELPMSVRTSTLKSRKEDIEREMGCSITFRSGEGLTPGCVAVDVPRKDRAYVNTEQVLDTAWARDPNGDYLPELNGTLPAALGVDGNGVPLYIDLAETPHMLVAGTTGSGKSVFLQTLMATAAAYTGPDRLRIAICDTKRVGYGALTNLPHHSRTALSVVEAVRLVEAAARMVDARYAIMARDQIQDLKEVPGKWPRYLIVADEFSDVMLAAGKTLGKRFENACMRIAQVGRACGVHLVLATQKPVAAVVTPILKGNLPCRVALKTTSAAESRVIMDKAGAENLLGNGDFISPELPVMTPKKGGKGASTKNIPVHDAQTALTKDLPKLVNAIKEAVKATKLVQGLSNQEEG